MKKIAVIGANGNMGKRYALILEQYSKCEVVRIDTDNQNDNISDCDGFIVATPTDTHADVIFKLSTYRKPILCEKPLIRSRLKMQALMSIEGLDLSMINQYSFLDNKNSYGHTYYNYFKSGSDSLYWDCINVIGTARSSYNVANDNVIWTCWLNGKMISIADMDTAYIDNITSWVDGWRNKDYILPAHEKIWSILHAQEGK